MLPLEQHEVLNLSFSLTYPERLGNESIVGSLTLFYPLYHIDQIAFLENSRVKRASTTTRNGFLLQMFPRAAEFLPKDQTFPLFEGCRQTTLWRWRCLIGIPFRLHLKCNIAPPKSPGFRMWQWTVASNYNSALYVMLLEPKVSTLSQLQTIWSCSFILFKLNPFNEMEGKLTIQKSVRWYYAKK